MAMVDFRRFLQFAFLDFFTGIGDTPSRFGKQRGSPWFLCCPVHISPLTGVHAYIRVVEIARLSSAENLLHIFSLGVDAVIVLHAEEKNMSAYKGER